MLSSTANVPLKATPGMSMATVAESLPTMPPLAAAGTMVKVPLPWLTTTTSRSALPSRRLRFARATVMTKLGVAGKEPSALSTARRSND